MSDWETSRLATTSYLAISTGVYERVSLYFVTGYKCQAAWKPKPWVWYRPWEWGSGRWEADLSQPVTPGRVSRLHDAWERVA
jgi:hypothetical protein